MEASNMISIRMTELAREVSRTPDSLVTRPVGRRFLPLLEAILTDLLDSQACVLECGEVRIMDASFADEVFGVLTVSRSRRQRRGGCVILDGLEDANLDNLEMALASRTVRETGLRNCVMPVRTTRHDIRLAGKCEAHVQRTFELLAEHRQLTARELADVLALDIAAASTRLKVLFDLGLATRVEERDGQIKQFVYSWPL
jgi:DNA-binding transcriptional ArsR family regulator